MPIKYNLTKFDMLSNRIKKTAAKGAVKGNGWSGGGNAPNLPEDDLTRIKAIIIASFASGHSWQTSKALTEPGIMINSPDVKKEYLEAKEKKWQSISNFDIVEVSSKNVNDASFSQWLFFNVDRSQHDDYKKAWSELKGEFNEDCDDVDKKNPI